MTGRRPRLGAWLKGAALASVNRLTGRHAVLLSAAARRADSIIDLRAPYRVDGPMLTLELRHAGPGRLTSAVLAYEGHFPGRTLWTAPARDYAGPCELSLDLTTGSVRLAGHQWGRVPLPLPSRRFCWHLALVGPDGSKRQRSADPVHETLRDWWVADARFRRLLTERDLGDFVTCVAVRA